MGATQGRATSTARAVTSSRTEPVCPRRGPPGGEPWLTDVLLLVLGVLQCGVPVTPLGWTGHSSVSPGDSASWQDGQCVLYHFRSDGLTAARGSRAGLPPLRAVARGAVFPPHGSVLGNGDRSPQPRHKPLVFPPLCFQAALLRGTSVRGPGVRMGARVSAGGTPTSVSARSGSAARTASKVRGWLPALETLLRGLRAHMGLHVQSCGLWWHVCPMAWAPLGCRSMHGTRQG